MSSSNGVFEIGHAGMQGHMAHQLEKMSNSFNICSGQKPVLLLTHIRTFRELRLYC